MSHTTTISVYKITNTLNGKSYVGVARDVQKRFYQHARKSSECGSIRDAILKYGADVFTCAILGSFTNREDAYAFEKLMIQEHKTLSPTGYNQTDGGDGFYSMSISARRKLSVAKRGKPSPRTGVKLSETTKSKISVARKGVSNATPASREIWKQQRTGNRYAKACGVKQMNKQGLELKVYRSIKKAAEISGVNRTGINNVCLGKRKTAGGYTWSYT
jgi:group I intron endonuclease